MEAANTDSTSAANGSPTSHELENTEVWVTAGSMSVSGYGALCRNPDPKGSCGTHEAGHLTSP